MAADFGINGAVGLTWNMLYPIGAPLRVTTYVVNLSGGNRPSFCCTLPDLRSSTSAPPLPAAPSGGSPTDRPRRQGSLPAAVLPGSNPGPPARPPPRLVIYPGALPILDCGPHPMVDEKEIGGRRAFDAEHVRPERSHHILTGLRVIAGIADSCGRGGGGGRDAGPADQRGVIGAPVGQLFQPGCEHVRPRKQTQPLLIVCVLFDWEEDVE